MLLLTRNPKMTLIALITPLLIFLLVTLVVFVMGVIGIGASPFEFCGKPAIKTASDVETKYEDAFAFGDYLKREVPELTNEQIYGLLGNVAVESSDMGTRAFQGYYMFLPAEREAMLDNDNQWWLDRSSGKSAHAVGLIQWDPASKLINVAVSEGVHWTDSNFQFKQALIYFKGRSEWSKFLVPGNTTAYYAELGMEMEGCQIGASGCTPEERSTSANQFSGHDFTAGGAVGNSCSGVSAGGWINPFSDEAANPDSDVDIKPSDFKLTSLFGPRASDCYGTGYCSSSYHRGIDLVKRGGETCGANIYAANSGTVTWAGYNGGEGNSVHIQHANGIMTKYFHMPDVNGMVVKSGSQVTAGQIIGHVGTTGASSGCHLHFEIHVNGKAIDPIPFLKTFGIDIPLN